VCEYKYLLQCLNLKGKLTSIRKGTQTTMSVNQTEIECVEEETTFVTVVDCVFVGDPGKRYRSYK
jgi:hypothetical protein